VPGGTFGGRWLMSATGSREEEVTDDDGRVGLGMLFMESPGEGEREG